MRDLPAGLLREVVDLELGLEELAVAGQGGAVVVDGRVFDSCCCGGGGSGRRVRRRRGEGETSSDSRSGCRDCSCGGCSCSGSSSVRASSNSSCCCCPSSKAQRRGLRRGDERARLGGLLRPLRAAQRDRGERVDVWRSRRSGAGSGTSSGSSSTGGGRSNGGGSGGGSSRGCDDAVLDGGDGFFSCDARRFSTDLDACKGLGVG